MHGPRKRQPIVRLGTSDVAEVPYNRTLLDCMRTKLQYGSSDPRIVGLLTALSCCGIPAIELEAALLYQKYYMQ